MEFHNQNGISASISLLAKSSKIWYNNGEFLLYTKEEVAHDSDMSKR